MKSIDALSRDQLGAVVMRLGLQDVSIPLLLPGAKKASIPLTPSLTSEDRKVVENVSKIFAFLTRGASGGVSSDFDGSTLAADLLPVLPTLAGEVLPDLTARLASRITARFVREFFV